MTGTLKWQVCSAKLKARPPRVEVASRQARSVGHVRFVHYRFAWVEGRRGKISLMGARGLVAGIDIVRPNDTYPKEFQNEEDHAE